MGCNVICKLANNCKPQPTPTPEPPPSQPITGQAKVKILWPSRSRSVTVNGLSSALSANITVSSATTGATVDQFLANRDASRLGGYSETYTGSAKLELTPIVIQVEFRTDADGRGELVGIATASPSKPDSENTGGPVVTIDPVGKIQKVTILANQKLGLNETKEFSFLAQSADNVTIPTTPGSGIWSILQGIEVLKLTSDGKATGLSYGKAKIKVRVDQIDSPVQEITVTDPRRELRDFITGMQSIDTLPDNTSTVGVSSYEQDDRIFTKTRYRTTINVTELAGFNPNIGTIWPGALVQGKSLKSGVLSPVNVARTPGTLLLSTLGTPSNDGKTEPRSKQVDRPSAATIEDARVQMINNGFLVPAKLSQVFKEFSSIDHAMVQIGASASYLGSSIKASLDSDSYSSNRNVMVLFTQEYYTIAMDAPTSPTSYFSNEVVVEDLQPYANTGDNPLCYVQSVTYGRMGMLFASSSVDIETLKRSIEATVRWASGNFSAYVGSQEEKVAKASDVKMLLLGGSPDSGLQLIPTTDQAIQTLADWIKQPITNSPRDIQLGLPISYKVNYLKDNAFAKLSFTTDYDKLASSPIPQLTDWVVTFVTGNNDKDFDTGLVVEVFSGSRLIANYAENGRKFDNGSSITVRLSKVDKMYERDKGNIRFHVRINPNGNDTWEFQFVVSATSTGGGGFSRSGPMRLSEGNRDGWA